MKLVVISYEWPPGGQGMSAHYLAKSLPCHVITNGGKNRSWTSLNLIDWLMQTQAWLKSTISEIDVDGVIIMGGFPGAFLNTYGKPTVVSLMGSDVPGFNERMSIPYFLCGPIYRKALSKSRLVANSKGLRELAEQTIDQEIDVIPNIIDVNTVPIGATRKNRAIFVGRNIPRKQLWKAKKECEVAGLPLDIHTNTPHKEVLELFQYYDFYICTSKHEGMSNSMMEAMAGGCIVITTPCGGHQELVTHDTGYVMHRGMLEAFRGGIKDPMKIREHVRKVCDKDFVARKYMEYFRAADAAGATE